MKFDKLNMTKTEKSLLWPSEERSWSITKYIKKTKTEKDHNGQRRALMPRRKIVLKKSLKVHQTQKRAPSCHKKKLRGQFKKYITKTEKNYKGQKGASRPQRKIVLKNSLKGHQKQKRAFVAIKRTFMVN